MRYCARRPGRACGYNGVTQLGGVHPPGVLLRGAVECGSVYHSGRSQVARWRPESKEAQRAQVIDRAIAAIKHIAACGSPTTTVLDSLSAQPYGMAAPLDSWSEDAVPICSAERTFICDFGDPFLLYFIQRVLSRVATLSIHAPSRILHYLCANPVRGKIDAWCLRSPRYMPGCSPPHGQPCEYATQHFTPE